MKIVIVGGGTAGWISALILKNETNHEVSLIDSSSIGPLGVGESTTGLFCGTIRKYLHEETFVDKCGITPKLGTQFIGWSDKNFFSPLEGTFSTHNHFDYAFYYGVQNSTLSNYSPFSLLATYNKINFDKSTTKEQFISDKSHAYHLDTYKTIAYLKEKCIDFGVNFIDSKVTHVSQDEMGKVNKIHTEDTIIDCDFIIDCSGFNRIIASTYQPKFISYQKWLSVNTGLPFNLSWDDVDYQKPVTSAVALSCGWMWMIPTRHSIGCGIVFDDNFASQEEIIAEVQELLGVDIKIRKEIKFQSGRLENSLYCNVATIGTAYSFLEPLQATSIHTTILQIERLIRLLKDEITTEQYNYFCGDVVDNYADFVSLHYQFNYIDNDFWKSRIPREYTASMIKKSKEGLLSPSDYNIQRDGYTKINSDYELIGHNLWSYVLAGGNLLTNQQVNYTQDQLDTIKRWQNTIPQKIESSMKFQDFIELYK